MRALSLRILCSRGGRGMSLPRIWPRSGIGSAKGGIASALAPVGSSKIRRPASGPSLGADKLMVLSAAKVRFEPGPVRKKPTFAPRKVAPFSTISGPSLMMYTPLATVTSAPLVILSPWQYTPGCSVCTTLLTTILLYRQVVSDGGVRDFNGSAMTGQSVAGSGVIVAPAVLALPPAVHTRPALSVA